MSVPPYATAEILAVGTELLVGGRSETNSLLLADALAALGIEVRYKSVVGDREADIVSALRVATGRVSLVVMTGGLGPTLDDCTRQAMATLTRRPLRQHPQAVRQVQAWLRSRGRTMTDQQRLQALVPSRGEVLRNPIGSAPGVLVRWKGCALVAMPGVPAEAQAMFEQSVVPKIRSLSRGRPRVIRRALLTFGLPESELEALVLNAVPSGPGLEFGTLASPLGVAITLTYTPSRAGARQTARSAPRNPAREIDRSLAAMRTTLGPLVFGEDRDTMEKIVGRLLSAQGATLATAESCTGGLIGHRLTQVSGASGYFLGGVVSYSNEAKTAMLAVPAELIRTHGAVSAPVAVAMAEGIRAKTGSTIGLSVTGIAGPGGATATKPVGLVYIGLAMAERATISQDFTFHGPRDAIKLRASQAALNCVRQALLQAVR